MTPRIVLITDPAYGDEVIVRAVASAGAALPAGFFAVQLRDKARSSAALDPLARALRAVTRDVGASLVINGHAELARNVGADGVHLGGDGDAVAEARRVAGPRTWISVAAHEDADVQAAVRDGADAALVSPIFATPGKPRPRGVAALAAARRIAGELLLYALGGVDERSAPACFAAGADGVAVIRALLASPDPARTARALHAAARADGLS